MAERRSFEFDVAGMRAGDSRAFTGGGKSILVVRTAVDWHAVDAICPHYHMPLDGGLVCEGTLRCPWHQSLFDLRTGHADEPPALAGLGVYPISVDDDRATVSIVAEPPDLPTRPATTSIGSIVLLGSGAAAMAAAIELRDRGFAGDIRMVSHDRREPYDRPNLSKEFLSGHVPVTDLPLAPDRRWSELGVSRLHRHVVSIEPNANRLHCADGSSIAFDQLLVATGGTPKTLDVPGPIGARNVCTLRSRDDAERIIALARGARRVAVIGSSFIAMEAGAALRERGLAVTIVTPGAQPFERVLGPRLGAVFRRLHRSRGIQFRTRSTVAALTGRDRSDGVQLASGERVAADFVVVGIGVTPTTDMLPKQWLDADGGVRVDASLRVSPNIFAAGDIARYPEARLAAPVRIEHWRLAEQHGQHAARAMLGDTSSFTAVPYFWSYQFGLGLDYVGHAERWDEVIFDGDESAGDFTQYFIQAGRVTAAAMLGRSPHASAMLEWMTRAGNPPAEMVRQPVDWIAEVRKLGVRPRSAHG